MREAIALERGLPANTDAERFILGSVVIRGLECFEILSATLRSDDFMLEKHRRIWSRMGGMYERGAAIDRITLVEEVNRFGELESVDGITYLASLDDGLPIVSNLDSYVQIVKEKAALRKLSVLCQHGMNQALIAEQPASEIITSMMTSMQAIDSEGAEPEWKTATQIIEEFPGGWQSLVSPAADGVSTGIKFPWPRVQQVICGMQKGELIMLAGRPSMGKSALATQIALSAAKQGESVAYVSLEMTGPALIRREISQEGRIDAGRMKLGYLNATDRDHLAKARHTVTGIPIYHETRQPHGRTVGAILKSLRYLIAREPVGLVVIDHFHLIDGPEREERIKYARIADGLQRAARDFQIPFLVLAQLNRKCEEEKREPGLSDLKECGKIEENADAVLAIHRPEMYPHLRDREDLRGEAKLIIAKQRDGATGYVDLIFIHSQTRFESRAEDVDGLQ